MGVEENHSSTSKSPMRHFGSHEDGGLEGIRGSGAFAGQVVGGAVVDAGADDGQAQGDVDAIHKVEEF